MSTEYYTEPDIPFDKILQAKSVDVKKPEHMKYAVPHIILHKNGSYIWAFLWEGRTRFERFGASKAQDVFPALMAEFNVEFFDEYGVPFATQRGNLPHS